MEMSRCARQGWPRPQPSLDRRLSSRVHPSHSCMQQCAAMRQQRPLHAVPAHGQSGPQALDSATVATLVELLQASSGPFLDTRLAQLTDQQHSSMAMLLQQRLQAARLYELQYRSAVSGAAVKQMQKLYRRLKQVEHQQTATPAMKLLDAVLTTLNATSPSPENFDGGDEDAASTSSTHVRNGQARTGSLQLVPEYEQRRVEARIMLRDAFVTAASAANAAKQAQGSAGIAAPASGQRQGLLAADESPWMPPSPPSSSSTARGDEGGLRSGGGHSQVGAVEAVPIANFIREVENLLQQAEQRQHELKQGLAARKRNSLGGAPDPVLVQAEVVYSERTIGLAQLEDVLAMAKSLRGARVRRRSSA